MKVERKARVSEIYRFIWVSPRPVVGTPQLKLYEPGSATAHVSTPLNLVELRADETITAILDDMKRLTAPAATVLGSRGAAGKYGAARLITPGGGVFRVHVATVADGEITLSERVPRQLPATAIAGSRLHWSTWTVELDAAITAAAVRDWRWQVVYEAFTGDDIFTSGTQIDSGLLHVVYNPFDTGLTSEMLVGWFPQAIPLQRAGAQDFSEAIELAEEMLISKIRAYAAKNDGTGTEDQLEGSDFRRIHALFACADLIEHAEPDQARSHRAKAFALLEERLMNVSWLDSNNDGVVDPGESNRIARAPAYGGFAGDLTRSPSFGPRSWP